MFLCCCEIELLRLIIPLHSCLSQYGTSFSDLICKIGALTTIHYSLRIAYEASCFLTMKSRNNLYVYSHCYVSCINVTDNYYAKILIFCKKQTNLT